MRALRIILFDPAIADHGGRVVNTAGDSRLVMFDSVGGAVRCAMRMQQQVPMCDGDQPKDRAIRFRVGINVGDVVPNGADIHGNVVNVTARLQAECPPGGICVSRAVRKHLRDRVDLDLEELGALKLKNIARAIEAFVLRLGSAATTLKSVETLPDRTSIAVLAFTDMSGDPDQEYLSDGFADNIITELSRNRSLFVIARTSSFGCVRYRASRLVLAGHHGYDPSVVRGERDAVLGMWVSSRQGTTGAHRAGLPPVSLPVWEAVQ